VTTTGAQIRERILDDYPELGFRGKTDALGTTSTLIDALRLKMASLSPNEFGDAYLRVTAGDANNLGYVGKIDYLTPSTGAITVSPVVSNAFASGATYEIWMNGIRPDDVDKSRDGAASEKCRIWRPKPLSLLSQCEDWVSPVNATILAGATAFPFSFFEKSIVVTNTGVNGYVPSESYYVQPAQRIRLFGLVQARVGAAAIRLRRITAPAADIALSPVSTFTFRGVQLFVLTAAIPSGCEEVQVWAGASGASDVSEWQGVGMLDETMTRMQLQPRVISEHDVGSVWAYGPSGSPLGSWQRYNVDARAHRERSGGLVAMYFDGVVLPGSGYALFYEEAHHYAALQSSYFTAADRAAGDLATTDCDPRYLAAATVRELFMSSVDNPQHPLAATIRAAVRNLNFWDREVGADPKLIVENPRASRIRMIKV
jgi:hypothetical protein